MIDLHQKARDHLTDLIERARAAGVQEPAAMSLATATSDGRPSVRTVLLRGMDARGLCFYTNLTSRKARELEANARAAVCFHWQPLVRQALVEGVTQLLPDAEADAYWVTRPRGHQLGAWASKQSQVLDSRETLDARLRRYEAWFEGKPVPRPPFWGGFRLVPETFEFWEGFADRLHHRERYVRDGDTWRYELLYP